MFTWLGYKLGTYFDIKEEQYYKMYLPTSYYPGGKWLLFGGFGSLVDLLLIGILIGTLIGKLL